MRVTCSTTSLRSFAARLFQTLRLVPFGTFHPPDVWQRLKRSNELLKGIERQQCGLSDEFGGEIGASNGNVSILPRLQFDLALAGASGWLRNTC